MAHRPEDSAAAPGTVTVHLPDLEPIGGLVAACARLSVCLTPEAIAGMPELAVEALAQIQSILWRLEHSRPEGG